MRYDIGDEIKYNNGDYIVLGKGVKANSKGIKANYLILEGVNNDDVLEVFEADITNTPKKEVEVAPKPTPAPKKEVKKAEPKKPTPKKEVKKAEPKKPAVKKEAAPKATVKKETIKKEETKKPVAKTTAKPVAKKAPAKKPEVKKEVIKPTPAPKKVEAPVNNLKQASKEVSNDNSNKDLQGLYGRVEEVKKPVAAKPVAKKEVIKPTPAPKKEVIIEKEIEVVIEPIETFDYKTFKPTPELPISRKVKTAFPKKTRNVKEKEVEVAPKPTPAPKKEVKKSEPVSKKSETPKWFTEPFNYVNAYKDVVEENKPIHGAPKNVINKAFQYNELQRKIITNEVRNNPRKLKAPSKYVKKPNLETVYKIGVVDYAIPKDEVKVKTSSNIKTKEEVIAKAPINAVNDQLLVKESSTKEIVGKPVEPTEKIIFEVTPDVEIATYEIPKYEDLFNDHSNEENSILDVQTKDENNLIIESLNNENWYDKIVKFKMNK